MTAVELHRAPGRAAVRALALRGWAGHARRTPLLVLSFGLAAAVAGQAPAGLQTALVVAAVAAFGLPHGALDMVGGPRLLPPSWPGPLRIAAYLALYLGAAALVLAAWLGTPALAIGGFLLLSVWHFGAGEIAPGRRVEWAEVLARGGLPILTPLLARPSETDAVFALLAGEGAAAAVRAAAPLAGAVWMVALAATAWRRWRARDQDAGLEIAALLTLFCLVPPLPAFAVYFCCVHAPRRWLLEDAPDGRFAEHFRQAWAPSLAAVALGALGWWALVASGAALDAAAHRVLFWGLAALTVPHMIQAAVQARATRSPHAHAMIRAGASVF